MLKQLTAGQWTRPSDKQAVYVEIGPEDRWGLRVTLFSDWAKVEAIQGPHGTWYKGPQRYSATVYPPTFFEKRRRITFEDKVMAEVEKKRQVISEENAVQP